MRAWTFIILRNLYLSLIRRARFKGHWDDLVADRILAAPASQDRPVDLGAILPPLLHLHQPARGALSAVGTADHAHEETAEFCGVTVRTITYRLTSARVP